MAREDEDLEPLEPLDEPLQPEPEGEGEERPGATYLARSRDLFNAIVLATPLFVGYQIGILVTDGWKNGLDFVTQRLFDLVGRETSLYVLLNLGILAALLIAARFIGKERRLTGGTWAFALLESTLYAGLLGVVVTQILGLLGLQPIGLSRAGVDELVLSFGAGAYEELVFRLLLLGGLLWLARRFSLRRPLALVLALTISSLLFSAAHYPPLGGDEWQLYSFAYRAVAGALFGLIFLLRGFAIAAWTHALYDVYVLMLL